jgi:Domain of unknown function (DUF2017)
MPRGEERIRRTRRGEFELRLPEIERRVLRSLPAQVRALLEARDPSTVRLFPPAYPEDAERQAEYERLVREDLLAQRLQALGVVEETLDARRLSADQVAAWLGALNDIRLVMGVQLGIERDGDGEDVDDEDPRAPMFALYHYLGWLVSQAVDALAEGLDPAGPARD